MISYYSNRARGARKRDDNGDDFPAPILIDEPPADARRKALGPADSESRRSQPSMAYATPAPPRAAYEVDPLKCLNCGATMRIIALIDDADVIERIRKHLKVWDPKPETISPAGPDPPSATCSLRCSTSCIPAVVAAGRKPAPRLPPRAGYRLNNGPTVAFDPAMADSPTQN